MTAKTRTAFKTAQAAAFADNTTGDITAADLRQQMDDLADSAIFPEDSINGAEGPQGPAGPAGADGATGPAGPGVPAGGTAGDAIRKTSATDYETEWATGVFTDPGTTGGSAITNVISLTQAQYDAIGTPDAATLYVIEG